MSTDKTQAEQLPQDAVIGSFYWVKPYAKDNYEPAKCKKRDNTDTLWFGFTDGSVMKVVEVSDFKELNFL
jgi:hypothetical protein